MRRWFALAVGVALVLVVLVRCSDTTPALPQFYGTVAATPPEFVTTYCGNCHLTLAAVAYFVPEALRRTRGFVYLEATGTDYDFTPRGFRQPAGTHFLTMAAGDVDGDGAQDLLLENFGDYLPEGERGGEDGLLYLVLRNLE